MAHKLASQSSIQPRRRERAAFLTRSVLLWLALAVTLAVAFLTDPFIMDAVAALRSSALAEFLQHTVRWLGTGYVQIAAVLALIVVGALLRRRSLRAGSRALISFLASGALATVLKVIVHRARPFTDVAPTGWNDYLHNSKFQSFPSGETTTTFAVAVMLGWWYPPWRVPLLIVAAVVGAARVVVGSHHPSDVVAGAMLGIAVAQSITHIADRKPQSGKTDVQV